MAASETYRTRAARSIIGKGFTKTLAALSAVAKASGSNPLGGRAVCTRGDSNGNTG
jgi:hypothetical protein